MNFKNYFLHHSSFEFFLPLQSILSFCHFSSDEENIGNQGLLCIFAAAVACRAVRPQSERRKANMNLDVELA